MNDVPASLNSPERSTRARRWRWLVALLVVLVAAGAGAGVYYFWPRPSVAPPELPGSNDWMVRAALEEARDAVLRNPRSGKAWGQLGLTYYANDFFPYAMPIFQEAERLDREDFRWPYFLGLMKFFANNSDPEALFYFERARRLTANEMPAYRMAMYHLAAKNTAEAERQFEEILKTSPGHGLASLRLGYIAFEREDLEQALKYFHDASELYIARREAYRFLIEIYTKKKQFDLAHHYKAHFDKMSEDLTDMDPVMLEASRLKVGRAVFLYNLDAAIRTEDYAKALELAKRLVKNYPDYDQAYTHLGFVLANLARKTAALGPKKEYLDQAEGYLNKAKEFNLKNANMWFSFGLVYQDRGFHWDVTLLRKAIDYYDKHLELAPTNELAIFDKASCLRRLGELSEAIAVLRLLVKNRPDVSFAVSTLGECLVQEGNWREGYHFLRIAGAENAPLSQEKALALQWLGKL